MVEILIKILVRLRDCLSKRVRPICLKSGVPMTLRGVDMLKSVAILSDLRHTDMATMLSVNQRLRTRLRRLAPGGGLILLN